MPRVAVLSDVHGNLAALEATLQAAADEGCEEIWFLGDAVGYGARPDEVCQLLKRSATLALAGNHDLAVVRPTRDLLIRFNEKILPLLEWMLKQLSEDSVGWLLERSPSAPATVPGIGLYHGSPQDPIWEYVLSEGALRRAWALVPDRLILVGHSHMPFAFAEQDALADRRQEEWFGLGQERWVMNPGSVGQPRDGDWRASYLLLDLPATGDWRACFRRVNYDVKRAMSEIHETGVLPEVWAARLALGQ